MRTVHIEFCGDNKNDTEKYKRYCGEAEFTPLSPSDEVIKFIEFQSFANQQLHIAKTERDLALLKSQNERLINCIDRINKALDNKEIISNGGPTHWQVNILLAEMEESK